MTMGKLKKKVLMLMLAGAIAMPLSLTIDQTPTAEAGWGDVIGAVVGGAAAHAQLDAEIKKYNDTEEGRQEYFQALKAELGEVDDWQKLKQLERIMTNLTNGIAAVDATVWEKPYNYFINKDESFNAFCTLGHNMSVNIGLYNYLTNEDEIAVVLGHEMGHGQKDHPAAGAKKSLNMQILGAATGSTLGSIAANIINNRHITKPQEREADKLAFEYITHTDYNPGATAAVWQRIMDKTGGSGSAFQQFMSDHPSNDDRRDTYVKSLYEYSGNKVTASDGVVTVNGKKFVAPAAAGDMSAAERSYFVLGNLAAAYHNGEDKKGASTNGSTVMLGRQPIMTCTAEDEPAATLAARLNEIK